MLANAADIIDTAHHVDPTPAGLPMQDQASWQPVLETAVQHLVARRPTQELHRELGLGL